MRLDFFKTPILEPGDDIGLIWFERFGVVAKDDDVKAQFLEPDDVTRLWGCTLSGVSGEIEVDGFSSRKPLQAWLQYYGIPVD